MKSFTMEEAEKDAIVAALRRTGGNKTKAAALLGIARQTLRAKLQTYQVDLDTPSRNEEIENALRNLAVAVKGIVITLQVKGIAGPYTLEGTYRDKTSGHKIVNAYKRAEEVIHKWTG